MSNVEMTKLKIVPKFLMKYFMSSVSYLILNLIFKIFNTVSLATKSVYTISILFAYLQNIGRYYVTFKLIMSAPTTLLPSPSNVCNMKI